IILPRMGTALKVLVLVLGMDYWPCWGFPVYDYDSASLREALSAAMAKVNSRSLSPYLFRAFRSSLKRVNVLDEDNVIMDLEFGIRETTCTRDSGADPSTCAFQRGHYMPAAACRGTVQLSARQVQETWVHCHWPSTSESDSSEEVGLPLVSFQTSLLGAGGPVVGRVAGQGSSASAGLGRGNLPGRQDHCPHLCVFQAFFILPPSPSLSLFPSSLRFSHPEVWDLVLKRPLAALQF
uniref:Secreted phosphoprotein 24 n=1 Tax=Sciurus vulgaris TaxID=55149 RepID=A0A8D2JQW2_SCIVU